MRGHCSFRMVTATLSVQGYRLFQKEWRLFFNFAFCCWSALYPWTQSCVQPNALILHNVELSDEWREAQSFEYLMTWNYTGIVLIRRWTSCIMPRTREWGIICDRCEIKGNYCKSSDIGVIIYIENFATIAEMFLGSCPYHNQIAPLCLTPGSELRWQLYMIP